MAGSPQARHAVSLTWQHLLLALLEALYYSRVSGSWRSSLPGTIRALKGSCVVIPCSFTYPGSRESLGGPFSVVWYQYRSRGYPEIYNSQDMASVLAEYQARTQLLGDPEMGNCTLSINPVQSEDAMSYYVWINPDSVRHRFYDVTVRVEVADTPDPLMLSDPGVLIEGDQTTITCSVRHTCPSAPPSLGWSPGGGKAATRHERLAGGGWRAESELSYTPSYKDHGQLLQCTATFPNQQQARNGLYLQVKYRPRGAAVAVVGPARLKEGDSVTLRCTSQSHPPATEYRWFQGPRRALLPGLGRGPEVTVPAVGRHSGPYRCAAENEIGLGEDSPAAHLDVEWDDNLLLMVSSGVIGGVLLLSVLAIVVYKVARARKDEEEGPSIFDNEGNGEQRQSLKGGKPSKAKKEEQFNLYNKAKAGGEELGIDDYEAMERVEDYENLAAGGAGHYGNVGTWQPHLLSEQIYSNV
ncbi:B-cell receptor CD22-like [Natator depressus]|uniref:B-cell receptor CD22-like n=1 Tax=Natator depressus TaxID=27790 RepID=UPI003EBBD952